MSSRTTGFPRRSHNFLTAVSGCPASASVHGGGELAEVAAVEVEEAVSRNEDGSPGESGKGRWSQFVPGIRPRGDPVGGQPLDGAVGAQDMGQSLAGVSIDGRCRLQGR